MKTKDNLELQKFDYYIASNKERGNTGRVDVLQNKKKKYIEFINK